MVNYVFASSDNRIEQNNQIMNQQIHHMHADKVTVNFIYFLMIRIIALVGIENYFYEMQVSYLTVFQVLIAMQKKWDEANQIWSFVSLIWC